MRSENTQTPVTGLVYHGDKGQWWFKQENEWVRYPSRKVRGLLYAHGFDPGGRLSPMAVELCRLYLECQVASVSDLPGYSAGVHETPFGKVLVPRTLPPYERAQVDDGSVGFMITHPLGSRWVALSSVVYKDRKNATRDAEYLEKTYGTVAEVQVVRIAPHK